MTEAVAFPGIVTRIPWITAITSLVPQLVVQIATFQLRCTAYANFVAKMPKNCIYALWWAGLAQKHCVWQVGERFVQSG